MQTSDGVICIHHEADWSSTATVSWSPRNNRREVTVEAQVLWDAEYSREDIDLPSYVAVRAVRLATRGRVMWEHGQVLSRPVPGRRHAPIAEPVQPHDPSDAWLFSHELATQNSMGPRRPGRPVPLGWVENVAIAMHTNGSTAVLVDIGAPHRAPCNCGKAFHDVGCPQSNAFPTIGRLALNLARVDAFCEALQRARTSVERIFVPEAPIS